MFRLVPPNFGQYINPVPAPIIPEEPAIDGSYGGIIMNANKIIAGLIVLIIAIAIAPSAMAQGPGPMHGYGNGMIDQNTMMELRAMHNPLGAQIRLTQLEKNLTRNILVGTEVINVITTNHPDANIENANTTLTALEALLNEVKTAAEGTDINMQAQQFVEIKKEGLDLTQQFREQTRTFLDANDIAQIHEKIQELDKNELRKMNNDIKIAVDKYNSERIREVLEAINSLDANEIALQIEQGRQMIRDAQERIREEYNALTPEQKQEASAKVRELGLRRNVKEQSIFGKAVQNIEKRMMDRNANRGQMLNQWMNQLRDQNKTNRGLGERIREMIHDTNFAQRINERIGPMNPMGPRGMPPNTPRGDFP